MINKTNLDIWRVLLWWYHHRYLFYLYHIGKFFMMFIQYFHNVVIHFYVLNSLKLYTFKNTQYFSFTHSFCFDLLCFASIFSIDTLYWETFINLFTSQTFIIDYFNFFSFKNHITFIQKSSPYLLSL